MTIIVERLPANTPGPSIVESVLTTPEAQIERGRYEINNSHDKIPTNMRLIPTTFVEPGKFSQITDRGKVFNALNTEFNLEIKGGNSPSVSVSITVEGVR